MASYSSIQKIKAFSISVKIDITNESVQFSNKLPSKLLGYTITLIGILSFLKAFFDLMITNGYGLAPIPFRASIAIGFLGMLIGWIVSRNGRIYMLTINFKDNCIVIENYKSREPLTFTIKKGDSFQVEEINDRIYVYLVKPENKVELFNFRNLIKRKYPAIKKDLEEELNNNINN